MKTMKKFWKYFINFIILFLLVSGLTYLGIGNSKNNGKSIECTVEPDSPAIQAQTTSPAIQINQCTNKKIIGTATNDTKVLINVIYIRADFYDENNNLIGTKYHEIKYFNVGEKAKFEIDFTYENVSRINITATETNI